MQIFQVKGGKFVKETDWIHAYPEVVTGRPEGGQIAAALTLDTSPRPAGNTVPLRRPAATGYSRRCKNELRHGNGPQPRSRRTGGCANEEAHGHRVRARRHRGGRRGGAGAALAQQKQVIIGGSATAPGRPRSNGIAICPGIARLHRPGEQQGRSRGLQDQGHRDRQRVQGAAGHRGARALQEGRRGARRPLRHAADRGAEQEAEEDKILGTSPGFGTAAGRRRQALPLHLPDRGQLLVAGRRRGGIRQGKAGRRPQGQEDRLSLLRQSGRARSRCRSSRISPRPKASSCGPSRCRRRASRWARRCSTSPGRYKPDFVIAHLFGRAPSVSIKELKGKGFPLSKVVAFVWGSVRSRHHRGRRHGRGRGLQHASSSPASARTSRCSRTSRRCTRRRARPPPKEMDSTVLYNRGVLIAALHVEAVAQRHQGQGRASADRRGRQEGHGADQGLHPGRPRAADGDHAGRPRGRRLGAGLDRSRAASS